MSDIKDADLFLQGQRDCAVGEQHESGKGEDYDRGYAYQHETEQLQDALTCQ